jgi:hypothetical protein
MTTTTNDHERHKMTRRTTKRQDALPNDKTHYQMTRRTTKRHNTATEQRMANKTEQ